MKTPIWLAGLIAGTILTATAKAQGPMRISTFDGQEHLTWSNTPAGHACFAQSADTLIQPAWSNGALSLAAESADLVLPTPRAFCRLAARPAHPLARYPLTANAADALGTCEDMILVNSPFSNEAIYCNGIYSGEPGGSSAGTVELTNLNFNGFIVAVEFMVATNEYRPVFIGGSLWRWGGAYTLGDGTLGLFLNGGGPYPGSETYATGVWHEVAFVYNAANTTAEVYLNGKLSARRVDVLQHNNDQNIHNTHYGNGNAFKGYWRNLRVWNLD